jgi:hypothetical protein
MLANRQFSRTSSCLLVSIPRTLIFASRPAFDTPYAMSVPSFEYEVVERATVPSALHVWADHDYRFACERFLQVENRLVLQPVVFAEKYRSPLVGREKRG